MRAFQVHLVSTGLSWPALNQTVCALRLFFGVTLGYDEIPERFAYPRRHQAADDMSTCSQKRSANLLMERAAFLDCSYVVHLAGPIWDTGRYHVFSVPWCQLNYGTCVQFPSRRSGLCCNDSSLLEWQSGWGVHVAFVNAACHACDKHLPSDCISLIGFRNLN